MTTLNILVRTERPQDRGAIQAIHDSAFNGLAEGQLVNLLRDSDFFVPKLSLVAEWDNAVIGHVLFSKVNLISIARTHKSLSLAPIAVHPRFQRSGIGEKLIRAGIDRARVRGFDSILVLGDPNYYRRFGFKHSLTKSIRSKYACEDYLGLELIPGSLSELKAASVEYPHAFSVV